MDIKYVTRFNEDVENFVATFQKCNNAIEEMRKINGTYKARRDEDEKETECQRKNLTFIMHDEDHPAEERAAAKQKLAKLEFHACLPTLEERSAYCNAMERAKKYAHDLEDCRNALIASRKALKDAFVADELRTLKNDMSTYVFINRKIDKFPLNL